MLMMVWCGSFMLHNCENKLHIVCIPKFHLPYHHHPRLTTLFFILPHQNIKNSILGSWMSKFESSKREAFLINLQMIWKYLWKILEIFLSLYLIIFHMNSVKFSNPQNEIFYFLILLVCSWQILPSPNMKNNQN